MGARLCSRFACGDHGGRLDEIVFFPSDAVEGGVFVGHVLTMDRYQRAWMERGGSRGFISV